MNISGGKRDMLVHYSKVRLNYGIKFMMDKTYFDFLGILDADIIVPDIFSVSLQDFNSDSNGIVSGPIFCLSIGKAYSEGLNVNGENLARHDKPRGE